MKKVTSISCLTRAAMTLLLALFTTVSNATVTISVSTLEELTVQLGSSGTADEIQMTADITGTANLTVSAGRIVTLDLNGHTLNMASYALAVFGNLTVKDTSTDGNGVITRTSNFPVQVGGSSTYGTMTLESGKITGSYGIRVVNGSLTMNGGEVSAGSYTIYLDAKGSFVQNGGIVTSGKASTIQVKGSFEMNGGKIVATGTGQAINLFGDCSAVMNDGTIEALYGEGNSGGAGITAFKNTEFIMHGGTITAYQGALMGNGSISGSSNDGSNAKFIITGGTLTSTHDMAIYAPQVSGEVTITGGTITGAKSGIELRAGTLNITGGTITGNTESYDASDATYGYGVIGSAVAVVQHTTKQAIYVNISGGTLNGYVPLSEQNPLGNETADLQKINYYISGGVFHSTGTQAIVIEDYLNGPFVTGGRYTYSVAQYVVSRYFEYQDSNTDPYLILLPYYLADGSPYTLTSDMVVPVATYTKTLGEERVGKHQAWLVPFDYTITAADLEKFTFYKINMIANSPSPSQATSNEMWVFLTRLDEGAVLHANMPYVYKPKEAVTDYEFTSMDVTLKAKNTDVIAKSETLEDVYSFYGTYENTTATASDPFYYIGIDGNVSFGDAVTVGPYRWIIRKTNKFGSTPSYVREMHFFDGEDEATSIDNSQFMIHNEAGAWYSLDGRQFTGKPTKGGVYIVGGRKVVIK